MNTNIGYTRITEDPQYNRTQVDEILKEEASEQVLSKLEDQEPEYDDALMDQFWCAEGEFKEELEAMFRILARESLNDKLNNNSHFICGQKVIKDWFLAITNKEIHLILQNN